MPRSTSPNARDCIDACAIPAPAPCARTSAARADCGRSNKADTWCVSSTPTVRRSPGVVLTAVQSPLCQTERIFQLTRELRPLARLFVLEIDEYLATAGSLLLDCPRPALDVARRIALVAQPEVPAVRGDLDGSRQLLAVRDAKREIARLEPREHLVIEPGEVPEFERGPCVARQLIQKGIEHRHVLSEKG